MDRKKCPLCLLEVASAPRLDANAKEVRYWFNCDRCHGFEADDALVRCGVSLPSVYISAVCECRTTLDVTPVVQYDLDSGQSKVVGQSVEGEVHAFDKFPIFLRQKLQKLLRVVDRRSKTFGEWVEMREIDWRSGYATTHEEYAFLRDSLVQDDYLQVSTGSSKVRLTATGYDAIESNSLLPSVTVFISSTCYDLIDLRAELAESLRAAGCEIRASDTPEHFSVNHSANSIESCLLNVERSDVVLCIVDREYGPSLGEPYGHKSATQVEVEYAIKLKKPLYFFIRKQAYEEYSAFRKEKALLSLPESNWVEKAKPDRRQKWFDFVQEHIRLPTEPGRSNWFDQFSTSADLKRIALRRINEIRSGQIVTQ